MQASECKVCGCDAVYYRAPKDVCILACCSNGSCRTRWQPPAAGVDIFEAASNFKRKFGR